MANKEGINNCQQIPYTNGEVFSFVVDWEAIGPTWGDFQEALGDSLGVKIQRVSVRVPGDMTLEQGLNLSSVRVFYGKFGKRTSSVVISTNPFSGHTV